MGSGPAALRLDDFLGFHFPDLLRSEAADPLIDFLVVRAHRAVHVLQSRR